jgi:signal transduction histidine kinase
VNARQATAGMPAGSRTAHRVAWLLCWLTLALIACALVLAILNSTGIGDLVFLVTVMSCAVAGVMVASRRPANPVGWFFLVSALSLATTMLTNEYVTYGLVSEPGSLPGSRAMVWPLTWLWVPGAVLILVFVPLYFPDGRLVSPRWRPVAWFAVFFSVFAAVLSALEPGDIQGSGFDNPLGIELPQPAAAVFDAVFLPFWLGLLFVSAASLVVRFRRSGGVERQQIKWLAFAAALVPVWFLVNSPVQQVFPNLFLVLDALFLASVPLATGVAILRYRLYDIDLLINRTLVYGALTTCVIGIYVLAVGYLGQLFRTNSNLLVSLIATGLVAVLFAPLRDRLQRGVNHLLYGERDDPYAALSRLGQRLEATLTPEAVLPTVTRTVKEALRLPYAAVEVEKNGIFEIAAETGGPVGDTVRLPLLYGGGPVGRLVLGRRPGEADFTPADRRLLEDLARQVGIAVHATRLTDEALRLSADLQTSRERLVTAREEERRRLRRDLHDGFGPQLASLAMKAEAARDLLAADPARSEALLEDVIAQTQEAVTDVRRLVYGLRPPALDDLGLIGALRAQAAHGYHDEPSVTIEVPDELRPLPAAVEVATYRIVQEALTNATRHAQARRCAVRIVPDEEMNALRLEVTDDGRGIPEDRSAGVGLSSMRERAEELGGSCKVETLPKGGTRVEAVLPLAPSPQAGEAVEPGVRGT